MNVLNNLSQNTAQLSVNIKDNHADEFFHEVNEE